MLSESLDLVGHWQSERRRCEQLLPSPWRTENRVWARVSQWTVSLDDDHPIMLVAESRAPIKCDSTIRLFHVTTKRNLHSHNYASPLSNNQEVSAYGENGVGDEGDRWKLVCTTKNDYWQRKDPIRLQHVVTGK